jgi:flagellar hook-basal body complex protein FliE
MVAAISQAASAYANALKRAQGGASGDDKKSDLLDVASAINNAEMTLQSVVSIRDKVISAYQEVIRMPI